jgi:hypothetical protein
MLVSQYSLKQAGQGACQAGQDNVTQRVFSARDNLLKVGAKVTRLIHLDTGEF